MEAAAAAASVHAAITAGRAATQIPGFADKLSAADIEALDAADLTPLKINPVADRSGDGYAETWLHVSADR